MSQQPLLRGGLSYPRDFLLKYQHIYTPDMTIISRLSPYLSPPRLKQTQPSPLPPKRSTSDNSNAFVSPQRFQKICQKKSPYQSKTEKKTQKSPTYKTRSAATVPPLFSQKENFELNVNTNTYKSHSKAGLASSTGTTPQQTYPLRPLTSVPTTPNCVSSSINSAGNTAKNNVVSTTPEDHPETTEGKIGPSPLPSISSVSSPSQLNVYESKFTSLFLQSQTDTPESNTTKDNEVSSVSPKPLTTYNYIHDQMVNIYRDIADNPTSHPSNNTLSPPKSPPLNTVVSLPIIYYVSSPDSIKNTPSNWSPLDPKRTPKTNFSNSTPEENSFNTSAMSTPYQSSKTPYHATPGGRPISPLDEQRLVQRQKQIDYGYRTAGYLRYRLLVPKEKRKPDHPRTPKKAQGCSKRSWDGQLKKWRRDLHLWDPDNMEAFKALLNSELVETMVNGNPELAEIVCVVRDKLDNPILIDGDDCDSDGELSPIDTPHPPKSVVKKISGEPGLDRVARTLVF